MRANVIHHGDCLDVLRGELPESSIDLAYLDPPFPPMPPEQVTMLVGDEDPFAGTLDEESPDIPQGLGTVIDQVAVDAELRAYLRWLAPRFMEVRRVLKESGSVFVHTRPDGGFHVWLLADLIFGSRQFRNQIVWRYAASRPQQKHRQHFIETHDVILFYAKSSQNKFHPLAVPPSQDQLRYYSNPDKDSRGPYRSVLIQEATSERLSRLRTENRLIEPTRPGAAFREKRFLSEVGHRAVSDVWTDVPSKQRAAGGRDFYPLQKPEALIERILQAASDPGDVVLDPFCGSGTTLVSAHRLQRRWIGIDASFLAVSFAKNRLQELFGSASPVEVIGAPSTLEAAGELARREPREFERWVLSLLGARPLVGAALDPGIDGRLIFYDEPSGRPKEVIVQVKTRAVDADDVHELEEALALRGGAIGVIVSGAEADASAIEVAQRAGSYVSPVLRVPYPRLQVLTLGEILGGRTVEHPGHDALRDEEVRAVEPMFDDGFSN